MLATIQFRREKKQEKCRKFPMNATFIQLFESIRAIESYIVGRLIMYGLFDDDKWLPNNGQFGEEDDQNP